MVHTHAVVEVGGAPLYELALVRVGSVFGFVASVAHSHKILDVLSEPGPVEPLQNAVQCRLNTLVEFERVTVVVDQKGPAVEFWSEEMLGVGASKLNNHAVGLRVNAETVSVEETSKSRRKFVLSDLLLEEAVKESAEGVRELVDSDRLWVQEGRYFVLCSEKLLHDHFFLQDVEVALEFLERN